MNDYSGVSFKRDWLNHVLDPIIQDTGWSRKEYIQHATVTYDLITNENNEIELAYKLIGKIQEEKNIEDNEMRKMMKEIIQEEKEDS